MNTEKYKDFEIRDKLIVQYIGSGGDVVIPDGITHIHDYAFLSCENISSIVIPQSLTHIGAFAFHNLPSVKNVYYKGSIEDWCNIHFENRTANPLYATDNFYMTNEYDDYYLLTSLVIPDSVTVINSRTFSSCKTITSLVIGDNVKSICVEAFCGCKNLTSVTIPSSVTYIGEYAFYRCKNIADVYYKGSIEDWCKISFGSNTANPMYHADNLYMLDENNNYYLADDLEVVIPFDSSTMTGHTFYGFSCPISIVIPNNLRVVNLAPFANFPKLHVFVSKRSLGEKLRLWDKRNDDINIFYEGSEKEWNTVLSSGIYPANIRFNCTKGMYDEYRRI